MFLLLQESSSEQQEASASMRTETRLSLLSW